MANNSVWEQTDSETSEHKEDLDNFRKMATNLKSSNYHGTLATIRNELGLPAKTKRSEIEALLIFATNENFGLQPQTDIALMGMGLLRGFSRIQKRDEASKVRMQYSERRDAFLKSTNYIATRNGRCKSYEEAKSTKRGPKEGKTELDTICSTIDSDSTRYIIKVLSALYALKDINETLSAVKADFESKAEEIGRSPILWAKLEYIPDELLPKPCCFVKKFDKLEGVESSTQTADDSERYQTPTSPTAEQRDGGKPKQAEENQPPKRPHPAKHEKDSWKIVASVLIAAVVVMFLLFGKFHFIGSYTDHGSPNESEHTDNGGLIGGGSTDDGGQISVEQSDPKNAEKRIEIDLLYLGPFSGENNK